ncbi:MAG: HAMP domain-containing histidine kinase [Clostridia bacterium]|nr:HAMP domain-containing histidine kinase [Clostridia bacterium]
MDEKNNKWIYNIRSEADRMNKLIMQLLDLAKMENKKQEEYGVENLSKIVEKSVLTFESLTFEKNIKLETNIEENINLKCDSDDIKQLMTILIDNAIVHSYEENGKIIVNLSKEKNDIVLKVSNKGEPIPKEEEEKIFERFYKRDNSRNRDTSNYGLGLAIAKSIVSHYNGSITAHSENEYTTFKVVLIRK